MMKKPEESTCLPKIDALRELINSERPFFEAVWTAREKIFNHSSEIRQSWQSFAECVLEVGVSDEISKQDRFVASLVYHVERFKVALCEKLVLKTSSLQPLQQKLKKAIEDFKPSQYDKYIEKIDVAFHDFFYRDLQDISVSERARVITNGKAKAAGELVPVLVDCNDEELLFIGGGMQEKTYLNFDLLAVYKDNRKLLVDRYVNAFKKIQKDCDKPLTICFRRKYAGAYGIIRLSQDIGDRLPDNPVAVYSQTLDEINFLSKGKGENKNCVLFGDVVMTGYGLASWKKQMAKHKYSICNILVLTEFGDKEKVKDYPESLVTEIMPNISCKGGKKERLPGVYSWEDLDGRFTELAIERMFIPKILRKSISN